MFNLEVRYSDGSIYKDVYFLIYKLENKPPLEFNISELISRKTPDISSNYLFAQMNSYIDYKGDGFKKDLYDRLDKSLNILNNEIIYEDIYPLRMEIVSPILDIFDIDNIFYFLKNVAFTRIPSNLSDTFNHMIEKDAMGSRVQTYLKDDYLELIALTIIVKSVLGPIGHFGFLKSGNLGVNHKDYILSNFLVDNDVFTNYKPLLKLQGLIERVIMSSQGEELLEEKLIIEKCISKDEIPSFLLSSILIQRLGLISTENDNEEKNIITKIYNYIKNKIKFTGDVSRTIRDKSPNSSVKDETNETESPVEIYRSLTDVEEGKIIEFNWAVRSTDIIIRQLPKPISALVMEKDIIEAKKFLKKFESNCLFNKVQIVLLSTIFKNFLDPRTIEYIELGGLINMFSVAFSYLWNLNFKSLAIILTSSEEDSSDEIINFNTTTNRSRITKEIKDKISSLYGCSLSLSETNVINIVTESIDLISNEFFSRKWRVNVSAEYLIEAFGTKNIFIDSLLGDLRLSLGNFFIEHESLLRS